jgi:hypothetical protein
VANLTLTATKLGMMRGRIRRQDRQPNSACARLSAFIGAIIASLASWLDLNHRELLPQPAFRPRF